VEPWFPVAKAVVRPPLQLWFNWRFEGLDRIPAEGPIIMAGNHLSYLDPLAHAYFVLQAGRRPRFLAKRELFDHRLVGTVLRGTRQIPVDRGSGDQSPLEDAARAIGAGEVVVIYPEGTTATTAEDFSPGRGKTGAVRLALETGVPILPVATWGGQYVWRRDGRQSLAFGRPIWLRAGEPMRIDAGAKARPATDELMGALAELVASLRERYPARWTSDPSGDGRAPTPRREKRRG
jgi:1-acyl-sn-glycerol-3-phosphate acyltransferase